MLSTILKNSLTLTLFATVTTGVTAVINMVTRSTIIHQIAIQQKQLIDQVIPPDLYNNEMHDEYYVVTNSVLGNNKPHRLYVARKDNQPIAAALEITAPDGYAGEIQMLVGTDFHGKILGVRVVKHHETPGLGDKIEIRISNWITQFSGIQLHGANDYHFAVKKDGGDLDQFTGATITQRSVVNAIRRTALFVETLAEKLSSLPQCKDSSE